MNHLRMVVPLLLILPLVISHSGCSEKRDSSLFSSPSEKKDDPDRQSLERDIKALSGSKDPKNDDEANAKYEEAKERLIRRGSTIEAQLTEALLGSDDWGVRLGVISVLQGVATKRSISPLIQVLSDEQPLVAMNAEYTLREMTKHQEIPNTGEPIGANGLPAVPVRDVNDLDFENDLVLWTAWHSQHKTQLRKAWTDWWDKNKDSAKID